MLRQIKKGQGIGTIKVEDHYCAVIQDVPLNLSVDNSFAFDVCDLTHKLSPTQSYKFTRAGKNYETRIPTLQMMQDAIYMLHPDPIDQDVLLRLVNKITIIHNSIVNGTG